MSKLKNRVKRKQMDSRGRTEFKSFEVLKMQMRELLDVQKYAEAMDVMAEMAKIDSVDADVMYWGALCYFETGDYDRATKWLDNVLSYVPNHVKAELLLAHICMIQDRENAGLKLVENILKNYSGAIDTEDKSRLGDILVYYKYGDVSELQDFPAIRAFLGVEEDKGGDTDDGYDSSVAAIESLNKLRNLLSEHTVDDAENVVSEYAIQEDKDDTFDVQATIEQVMSQKISLQDKIKLFNAFAGACYQQDDLQSAFALLSAALELDSCHADVLRNIAYVCLAIGEKEKALEYVAKLPMLDFALLHAIRQEM